MDVGKEKKLGGGFGSLGGLMRFYRCFNHPSWRENPQYFLHVENAVEMTIELTQSSTQHFIGVYVLQGNGTI